MNAVINVQSTAAIGLVMDGEHRETEVDPQVD